MKGTLYIQRDDKGRRIEKPKPIACEIDLDSEGEALAGVDRDIVATLTKARVAFISADGLFISGLIESERDIVRYQEWWFVPTGKERAEQ